MADKNLNLVDYLSDAVEGKIKALAAFRGYVTEKDICEIINNQTGIGLEGSENTVFTLKDLGMEE